jgi:hypothetical protein
MQETRRNGRLQAWPQFAKGSYLVLGTAFAARKAYRDYYHALVECVTIPGDRPRRRNC